MAAELQAARDEIERVDRHKLVNFDLTFDPIEPGPLGSDPDHPIPFQTILPACDLLKILSH